MGRFLLDTNVVSELRKRDRADPHVREWLNENVDAEFWLSALVVGELRRGVELIDRRDPAAGATLVAATALEHDLTLATRNVDDVERTGVALVNPFAPRSDPAQPGT